MAGVRRRDGRAGNELRPFAAELGALFRADGSARMAHGGTAVLAAVFGPGQAKSRRSEQPERAAVDVAFRLEQGQTTTKEKEYEQVIRQTFAPALLLDQYPRAVISIVVQVVEDHGSHVLSVAINAVALALMDAGVPMISVISSASCAIFPDGSIVLDPSTPEEEQAVSFVTTARSSAHDGVLTSVTSGLMSEEQYFASSEACQRAAESVAAFFRIVQQKKYPTGSG